MNGSCRKWKRLLLVGDQAEAGEPCTAIVCSHVMQETTWIVVPAGTTCRLPERSIRSREFVGVWHLSVMTGWLAMTQCVALVKV